MYVWDESKRQGNLTKHGLDFADARLVYENEGKITLESRQQGEDRLMDIAMVEIDNLLLALAYTERDGDIRIISFRRASRQERKFYASEKEQN